MGNKWMNLIGPINHTNKHYKYIQHTHPVHLNNRPPKRLGNGTEEIRHDAWLQEGLLLIRQLAVFEQQVIKGGESFSLHQPEKGRLRS